MGKKSISGRRKKKQTIRFCGAVARSDRRAGEGETDMLKLSWGGVSVEVPLTSLVSLQPSYRYACAKWIVYGGDEHDTVPVYEVQRNESEPLDHEVEDSLKRYCIIVGKDLRRWMCTKPFFDKLYEAVRQHIGL